MNLDGFRQCFQSILRRIDNKAKSIADISFILAQLNKQSNHLQEFGRLDPLSTHDDVTITKSTQVDLISPNNSSPSGRDTNRSVEAVPVPVKTNSFMHETTNQTANSFMHETTNQTANSFMHENANRQSHSHMMSLFELLEALSVYVVPIPQLSSLSDNQREYLKLFGILDRCMRLCQDLKASIDSDVLISSSDLINSVSNLPAIKICYANLSGQTHTGVIYEWEISSLGTLFFRDAFIRLYKIGSNSELQPLEMILYNYHLSLLDHYEPRVRNLVRSSLLAYLGTPLRIDLALCEELLSRVERKIDRTIASRETSLGSESSIPLDDTTGWTTLESDLLAFHEIYLQVLKLSRSSKEYLDLLTSISKNVDLIFDKCGNHINRYIRQATLSFIGSFFNTMKQYQVKLDLALDVINIVANVIARGLEDDWSQIRREAILSVKSYLIYFSSFEDDSSYSILLDVSLYPKLLPRLCFSRFYTAEGVRSTAQNAWTASVGQRGKELISKYAQQACEFYSSISTARNHMVVEAACHAMTEIALKIPFSETNRYVPSLIQALIKCLHQDSWPVRDAACISLGRVIHLYGEMVNKDDIEDIFQSLCHKQLKDVVRTVRENAAISLGDLLSCQSLDDVFTATSSNFAIKKYSIAQDIRTLALTYISKYLDSNFLNASKQSSAKLSKITFIPPTMFEKMINKTITDELQEIDVSRDYQNIEKIPTSNDIDSSYENHVNEFKNSTQIDSSINIERKVGEGGINLKKASGWGCCLDCITSESCTLWEDSEACIYLLCELSSKMPEVIHQKPHYIECFLQLLRINDFNEASKLHMTVLEKIPEIFGNTKQHQNIQDILVMHMQNLETVLSQYSAKEGNAMQKGPDDRAEDIIQEVKKYLISTSHTNYII